MNQPQPEKVQTYGIHGFTFYSEEERQSVAENHQLWPKFIEYWESKMGGPALMSDDETLRLFEFYIEGAYQAWEQSREITTA